MPTPNEGNELRRPDEQPSDRLAWEMPKLTVVHVEKATQGGPNGVNDQEDTFYSLPS